jgi:hypothetical protein
MATRYGTGVNTWGRRAGIAAFGFTLLFAGSGCPDDVEAPAAAEPDGSPDVAQDAAWAQDAHLAPSGACSTEGATVSWDFFDSGKDAQVPGTCTCAKGQWHCCPTALNLDGLNCKKTSIECWEEDQRCEVGILHCGCLDIFPQIVCQNGTYNAICWHCPVCPEASAD